MNALKRSICGGCQADTYLHPYRGAWRCPDCGHVDHPLHRPTKPPAAGKAKRWIWTRERIIAAMNVWAAKHGRAPSSKQWVKAGRSHPTTTTVRYVFGTWNAAIIAAGLEPWRRRTPNRCAECGADFDAYTVRCGLCRSRHSVRALRQRAVA